MMWRILIVEDDRDMQFLLSSILKDEGYETITAGDGNEALKYIKKDFIDLVLLDIKLPGMGGIEVLEQIKKIDNDLIVIVLTGYGNIRGAVKAIKLGALEYITKPFKSKDLVLVIKKVFEIKGLTKKMENLRERLSDKIAIEALMGESPQIKQAIEQVKVVAPTNVTVIIQGESGTGKELIVQIIHQNSKRKDKPLISIDCGTIPETLATSELFGYEKGAFTGAANTKVGKFEQANGGTLFLDEITNLPESAQAKLLRAIEQKEFQHIGGMKTIKVDVRIIVATNINLSEAVKEGKFRADLFHRLNEFQILLPPLRERKEDIPLLASYFLYEANQEFRKKIEGISSNAMKYLLDFHWPGNVRELRNTVKRGVLLTDSGYITLQNLLPNIPNITNQLEKIYLGEDLTKGLSLSELTRMSTKEMERRIIKQTLDEVGGNKSKAARILKIDRMTLYSKLKEFHLYQD